jgi:nicotinate-nucleotide adenylyltransferase
MNLPLNSGLNVALFGGTFDPIHAGHLRVIEKLANKFDLIMVIPAKDPQLKDSAVIASAEDRLTMCELALDDLPESIKDKVALNDIEYNRSGPTYTYDTLHQLRGFFPRDNFTLILGTDSAAQLGKWKRGKDLPNMAKILVVARPGVPKREFAQIEIDALELSSTQIREKLISGDREGIAELLSPQVAQYISEHNLYSAKATS